MSKIKKLVSKPTGELDKPQVFLALLLVFLVMFFMLGVYWVAFDDNPPAEVFDVYLYNDNDQPAEFLVVAPGDTFVFGVNICKYTTASAVVRSTWVDELVFDEPPKFPASVEPGCDHGHIEVIVPSSLPPSDYELHFTLEYKVNPIAVRGVDFSVGKIIVVDDK